MSSKIIGVVLCLAAVQAAPSADSAADNQFFAIHDMSPPMPGMHPMANAMMNPDMNMGGPLPVAEAYPIEGSGHPPHPFGPLPRNCKMEHEILVVNSCKPTIERVCDMQMVDTEEIEYDKICKSVVENLCNNMPLGGPFVRRDAEADGMGEEMFGNHFAKAHTSITKVKSTCQEVTTEHCFNNPHVKNVPVEVENCNPVTKANCREVEKRIPKTICEPVETTIRSNSGFPGGK